MTRTLGLSALALACSLGAAGAQEATMSFFVTSENPGKGADLGGLAGADAWCASLAEAAGVTGKTWRAYLSTSAENARDRIGDGPGSTPRARRSPRASPRCTTTTPPASPRRPPSTRRARSSTAAATPPTATTS